MLKSLLRRAAQRMGYDVQLFHPGVSQLAQLRTMLAAQRVNLVLDVGANTGQFARELRRYLGYRGRIVSFEPLCAAHAGLLAMAAGDPHWEVAPRVAIGARRSSVTLNISANSVSSSVLAMLATHVEAAPDSRYVGTEVVPLEPLDALALRYFNDDSRAFLKIDTQGYESEVLAGAAQTLSRVVGLQLELSLVPLYEGQLLMSALMKQINELGFSLWAAAPAFVDPRTGRTLQIDATFMRG